jgi:hypothetical protein
MADEFEAALREVRKAHRVLFCFYEKLRRSCAALMAEFTEVKFQFVTNGYRKDPFGLPEPERSNSFCKLLPLLRMDLVYAKPNDELPKWRPDSEKYILVLSIILDTGILQDNRSHRTDKVNQNFLRTNFEEKETQLIIFAIYCKRQPEKDIDFMREIYDSVDWKCSPETLLSFNKHSGEFLVYGVEINIEEHLKNKDTIQKFAADFRKTIKEKMS